MAKKIATDQAVIILTPEEAAVFRSFMYDVATGFVTRTEGSAISNQDWGAVRDIAYDIVNTNPIGG